MQEVGRKKTGPLLYPQPIDISQLHCDILIKIWTWLLTLRLNEKNSQNTMRKKMGEAYNFACVNHSLYAKFNTKKVLSILRDLLSKIYTMPREECILTREDREASDTFKTVAKLAAQEWKRILESPKWQKGVNYFYFMGDISPQMCKLLHILNLIFMRYNPSINFPIWIDSRPYITSQRETVTLPNQDYLKDTYTSILLEIGKSPWALKEKWCYKIQTEDEHNFSRLDYTLFVWEGPTSEMLTKIIDAINPFVFKDVGDVIPLDVWERKNTEPDDELEGDGVPALLIRNHKLDDVVRALGLQLEQEKVGAFDCLNSIARQTVEIWNYFKLSRDWRLEGDYFRFHGILSDKTIEFFCGLLMILIKNDPSISYPFFSQNKTIYYRPGHTVNFQPDCYTFFNSLFLKIRQPSWLLESKIGYTTQPAHSVTFSNPDYVLLVDKRCTFKHLSLLMQVLIPFIFDDATPVVSLNVWQKNDLTGDGFPGLLIQKDKLDDVVKTLRIFWFKPEEISETEPTTEDI